MSHVEPTYGGADWAAGFTDGEAPEEIQDEVTGSAPVPPVVPVPVPAADAADAATAAYEWSFFQKGAMFAVIIGCVALYVRITRRRSAREDVGYEKTLS